jgi:hypothetical protein
MWIDSESSRSIVIRNESGTSREISVLISPPFQLESGCDLPTAVAACAEVSVPIVLPVPPPSRAAVRADEHDAFSCAPKGFVSVRGVSWTHFLIFLLFSKIDFSQNCLGFCFLDFLP